MDYHGRHYSSRRVERLGTAVMYKYQDPNFTGYVRKDLRGMPCTQCGEPSVYKGRRLCYIHGSERDHRYRLSRGQKKKTIRYSTRPSKQTLARKKLKLIYQDVVLPIILEGKYSKNIFGHELAGTNYTKGYISVLSADGAFVKTKDGRIFDRNDFKFKLIYRRDDV